MQSSYLKKLRLGTDVTWDRILHVVLLIIIVSFIVMIDSEKTKQVKKADDARLKELFLQNKMKNELIRETIQETPAVTEAPKQKTFTGTIEAVDTSCFSDGICSVTLSGKKVVTTIGSRRTLVKDVGTMNLKSTIEFKDHIGEKAEVYGLPTDDGFTLYGSTDYYLNLVK